MKILVISYHYPPDPAVGGLRAKRLVDTLRQAGHDVHVVAAGETAAQDDADRVAPLPSVSVVYAKLRRIFARLRHSPREKPAEISKSHGPGSGPKTPFWKRWIYSFIWLPDDKQGFVLPALAHALKLPGKRPSLIYTTAPPYSVHLVGLLLSVLTNTRWVAEFRDPWTSNPWKPPEFKSAFSDWLDRRLERLCTEAADLLVAVSDGIDHRLQETAATTPRITVRNGISNLSPANRATGEHHQRDSFEIVYAGSFYHARDPFPFLEAVRSLILSQAAEFDPLRVRLIGSTESYAGRSIRNYVRTAGMESHVSIEGWMDPNVCLLHMQKADALLLLALNQPDQVPNKLYDYLGTRRPILAVADEEGESARMLREVGGHVVVPVNEKEQIRAALERMLRDGSTGPVGDPDVLEGWTTAVQMARLSKEIDALGP